jgi:hypothetical protein
VGFYLERMKALIDRHGRTARVDENLPATAAVRPRPRTMAATGRASMSGSAARSPTSPHTCPTATAYAPDAAALRRISCPLGLRSKDGYEDSVLPTGDRAGAPEDALDTACGLYLGDPTAWA